MSQKLPPGSSGGKTGVRPRLGSQGRLIGGIGAYALLDVAEQLLWGGKTTRLAGLR